MSDHLKIRKVAVLGAGVMGAQIAAHLVNANVETLLFELPSKEGDPNGNVNKALEGLKLQAEAPRRMGDPDEFAHCCAFVIENGYLNAETIRLDAATRLRAR